MQFSDKLNFLMNITQTSNKELALGISVDRSLVSLLRSGKRGMPRNLAHIRHMALFFAKRCTADFQRHALAEMLGLSALRSSLPTEVLAQHLEKWLQGDMDIVGQIIDSIDSMPSNSSVINKTEEADISAPPNETTFYHGNEGRRSAMRHMMKIIREADTPGSILVSSDDNLDWLFEDYQFASELQAFLTEVLRRGFTFHQIMPSMNYINAYVESLRYWLPIYISATSKVYYYPRLRDNLYHHATIILPGRCVQSVTGIGPGSRNHITLLSTESKLVDGFMQLYQEHLALCRPALTPHRDHKEFAPCLRNMFSRDCAMIQKVSPLSASTIPRELLEICISQTESSMWKSTYQLFLEEIPHFEERLKHFSYIDIACLPSAKEIREGRIPIGCPCITCESHPVYTPETYILHLKNILRLMEQYDNYHFLPLRKDTSQDYSMLVSEDGLALLLRNTMPALMLEILRPEMVQAFREHLMRMVEQIGYEGFHKEKVRLHIKALIRELQE